MAGHSKWANIKFRKMGQDAKKGKLFTKYIREITVSTRQGGSDIDANPRLRAALDKALAANMTRDTIERAIKRGTGNQEGQQLEEIRYEGYGPGGIALLIDCMTNNRKRTVSEVRHLLTKYGGNLGTDGSVAYLFNKKGQIVFEPGTDEDKVMNMALEYGAEDIQTDADKTIEITTAFEDFFKIKEAMVEAGLVPERAEISWVPTSVVLLEDKAMVEKFIKLIELLEDLEDVQAVYYNANIPTDILSSFS